MPRQLSLTRCRSELFAVKSQHAVCSHLLKGGMSPPVKAFDTTRHDFPTAHFHYQLHRSLSASLRQFNAEIKKNTTKRSKVHLVLCRCLYQSPPVQWHGQDDFVIILPMHVSLVSAMAECPCLPLLYSLTHALTLAHAHAHTFTQAHTATQLLAGIWECLGLHLKQFTREIIAL